ncbi:MAG TPA: sulfur carrier protein ThiS [Longimicrobiales bacterium]|nr:sulfur carrier protein ThiS [Longimicrobiales bacterium]
MSGNGTVRVHLNGKDREVASGMSVRALLESLELHPSLVVVELNREILERDRYADVPVREGDNIELVHFVGGG